MCACALDRFAHKSIRDNAEKVLTLLAQRTTGVRPSSNDLAARRFQGRRCLCVRVYLVGVLVFEICAARRSTRRVRALPRVVGFHFCRQRARDGAKCARSIDGAFTCVSKHKYNRNACGAQGRRAHSASGDGDTEGLRIAGGHLLPTAGGRGGRAGGGGRRGRAGGGGRCGKVDAGAGDGSWDGEKARATAAFWGEGDANGPSQDEGSSARGGVGGECSQGGFCC